jgi:hypothetical protein
MSIVFALCVVAGVIVGLLVRNYAYAREVQRREQRATAEWTETAKPRGVHAPRFGPSTRPVMVASTRELERETTRHMF